MNIFATHKNTALGVGRGSVEEWDVFAKSVACRGPFVREKSRHGAFMREKCRRHGPGSSCGHGYKSSPAAGWCVGCVVEGTVEVEGNTT